MKTKICARCKKELPISSFSKKTKSKKIGKIIYRSYCKDCFKEKCREYNKKRFEEEKAKREEILKNIDFSQTQICRICGKEKPLSDFKFRYVRKTDNKPFFETPCNECLKKINSEYCKKRYREEKQKEKEIFQKTDLSKTKKCIKCGEEKPLTEFKFRYIRKRDNIPVFENRCNECLKKYLREYRQKLMKDSKKRKEMIERQRRYREEHREELRRKDRERYHNNLMYNLNKRISVMINESLKNGKQFKQLEEILPYTLEQLKKELEKKFEPGMTWEKFLKGEIHIDHQIPKSWFYYESPDDWQFKVCWSLCNLQPKWAEDNIKKNNRYIG